MALLVVGFILVAGAHFLYEGVLLPSFRLHIRYKLYALRDQIRALKVKHNEEVPDEVFKYLHNGINGTLKILPYLDFGLLGRFNHEYSTNPELRKRIEERTKMLDGCRLKEIHEIKGQLIGYTWRSIFVNTGGWLIYFFPLIIALFAITIVVGALNKCKVYLRQKIAAIVFAPEKTEQYVPIGYVIDSSAELRF